MSLNYTLHGMILAAGFGTRMRPLTDHVPKPLLPVLGRPIVEYQATLLKNAGVENAVVNLHHLGDQIKDHISSCGLCGLNIEFSPEPDGILGTGGGLLNARPFLSDSTVVLLNGDTLLDFDISLLTARHFESGAQVTLLLKKTETTPDENSIYVDGNGFVRRLVGHGAPVDGLTHCAFLGVHVIEPAIFDYLPRSGCIIRKAYTRMVDEGLRVMGMLCDAEYSDIGNPSALFDANIQRLAGYSHIGPDCRIESGVVIGKGTVLTGGNTIMGGATIENSLVLKGEIIRNGEKLRRIVAGYGLRLEV